MSSLVQLFGFIYNLPAAHNLLLKYIRFYIPFTWVVVDGLVMPDCAVFDELLVDLMYESEDD